jgi:hypothetical protein
MKSKIMTSIRIILTAALIGGVYSETGIFTAIFCVLVACALEVIPLAIGGIEQ